MRQIKVIFLDYDGVLNRTEPPTPTAMVNGIMTMADLEMVYRLNLIVDRTGAEIVLSSSWRHMPNWREAMKASGIVKDILDRTTVTAKHEGEGRRGKKIALWLAEHPEVERYAIIDDYADMQPEQLPNFFHTDHRKGLTQDIADAVEKHLQSEYEPAGSVRPAAEAGDTATVQGGTAAGDRGDSGEGKASVAGGVSSPSLSAQPTR